MSAEPRPWHPTIIAIGLFGMVVMGVIIIYASINRLRTGAIVPTKPTKDIRVNVTAHDSDEFKWDKK